MKTLFNARAGLLLGAAFYALAGIVTPDMAAASDAKPYSDAYNEILKQAQQNVFTVLDKAAREPVATAEMLAVQQALSLGDRNKQHIDAAGVIGRLSEFTKHPDLATRIQAVMSMNYIANMYDDDQQFTRRTFIYMKEFDKDDQAPSVRAATMTAMALDAARSYPALEQEVLKYRLDRLETGSSEVKQAILRDFGQIFVSDLSQVMPVVLRYADSADPAVAAAAMGSLGVLVDLGADTGNAAFGKAIKAVLMPKTDPAVVAQAARALSSLYDNDHSRAAVIFMRLLPHLANTENEDVRFQSSMTLLHIARNERSFASLILGQVASVRLRDPAKQKALSDYADVVKRDAASGAATPAPPRP